MISIRDDIFKAKEAKKACDELRSKLAREAIVLLEEKANFENAISLFEKNKELQSFKIWSMRSVQGSRQICLAFPLAVCRF